jgi:hypothetical protein
MINAKRFAHMLVFCLTTTLGYSQDLESEYVAPVHPVPRGEAPGMKVQLLKGGMENKEYAVIFAKGDEAFSRIAGVCREIPDTKRSFHRYRRAKWSYFGLV